MDTSQAEVIKKCRKDLQKERIVKSVLSGMAVGLSVCFVISFITWIFEFKGLWLSLGLGVAAWVGAAFLFYFLVFKVTDMVVMQRIDRAGLDERMVTMYELQNDNSYIAQRQRADASAAFAMAVKKSGGQLIKMKIATAIICVAGIAGTFGVGMAVITGLSDYGVIPTLGVLCGGEGGAFGYHPSTPTYTVTYRVGGSECGGDVDGGTIEIGGTGNSDSSVIASSSEDGADRVQKGGTSVAQLVTASDDYYIVGYYIDNIGGEPEYYPSTQFVLPNVQKDTTVTVVFAKYDDEDQTNYSYYYDPNGKGDPNSDHHDPNDKDGDGEEKPEEPKTEKEEPPPSPSQGGGNPTVPGNTILDGETQYNEKYEFYYNIAMDMLANGTDGYPAELVAMIESYFGILL